MDTAGRIEKFKNRYGASPRTRAEEGRGEGRPSPAKKAEAPKENRAAKRAKAGKAKPKTEAAPPSRPPRPKSE